MALSNRSLSNSDTQNPNRMQISVHSIIEKYLERKFRNSRSYSTKSSYKVAINRFVDYLHVQHNLDLNQLLKKIKETQEIESIDLLDDYYSFLSKDKKRLRSSSIRLYLIVAKYFLNSEGCKIYREDLNQRFRLPKRIQVYEEGLTKETINRIIRLANPKLATIILMICSGGMRIAETIQIRLADVDFTKTPTTIKIRAETTKTRESRIVCISSEATNILQDYLEKYQFSSGYVFLKTHEQKTKELRSRVEKDDYDKPVFKQNDRKRLETLESEIRNLLNDELYAKCVSTTRHSLENQLYHLIENIPELAKKNENQRNSIHFHAFRAWFKTQVTDAHQSDFAEALMGHKSLKLVYYRQNVKARAKTYLDVEHALTIADTEKIDQNYSELQKDNLELRGVVDSISKQLRNLENRIDEQN